MAKTKYGYGEFETTITDKDGLEVDVVVEYKGYYDPGKLYGPPENCYPPEGEVEVLAIRGIDKADIPLAEFKRLEDLMWEHLFDFEEDYDIDVDVD